MRCRRPPAVIAVALGIAGCGGAGKDEVVCRDGAEFVRYPRMFGEWTWERQVSR